MIVDILSPILVDRIGWLLVHSIWQIAVIAIVVAIMLRSLPTRSANVRYSVCLLGLISIAAAPWITLGTLPDSTANRVAADRAVTSVESQTTDSISVPPTIVGGDGYQILLG